MAKESGRGRRNNRRQVNRPPASTKKQPLKPQQVAPARTSSLKTRNWRKKVRIEVIDLKVYIQ